MKKYIQNQGYTYVSHYNDLTNRQFTLQSINYQDSETSTLSNKKLERVEIYTLFLKDLDSSFKDKMESIINNALNDGIDVYSSLINIENVENGYNVTMQFTIR